MVLSPTSSAIIGQRPARTSPIASSVGRPNRLAASEALNASTPLGSLPPGVTLSPRELEVLTYMVEAMSNKQIARKLGLSEATVKTHVSALIAKLGVKDRVGAVVHALRTGLV